MRARARLPSVSKEVYVSRLDFQPFEGTLMKMILAFLKAWGLGMVTVVLVWLAGLIPDPWFLSDRIATILLIPGYLVAFGGGDGVHSGWLPFGPGFAVAILIDALLLAWPASWLFRRFQQRWHRR